LAFQVVDIKSFHQTRPDFDHQGLKRGKREGYKYDAIMCLTKGNKQALVNLVLKSSIRSHQVMSLWSLERERK
jgi:hypothetical protein